MRETIVGRELSTVTSRTKPSLSSTPPRRSTSVRWRASAAAGSKGVVTLLVIRYSRITYNFRLMTAVVGGHAPRQSGRGEVDAERFQVGGDAVAQQADLAQVAHQPAMQVAAEELAEGGLVAA